ncbi:hypothetical protein KY311_03705 [Candidatus Woesearchaeota archaeon]|nr:hypothetical protein [Candidatus Woesearchaeota archaeon]
MDSLIEFEKRAVHLEQEERNFIKSASFRKKESDIMFRQLHQQIAEMRQMILQMRNELSAVDEKFKDAVKELRRTVSKSDISTVDKKVQKFSPENLFPVESFRQMLEDEF